MDTTAVNAMAPLAGRGWRRHLSRGRVIVVRRGGPQPDTLQMVLEETIVHWFFAAL
jgi:hypothetical protein